MAAASAPSAPLRVVIIGAGVAGPSAASCLKDAKFWKSKGHFNEAPEVEAQHFFFLEEQSMGRRVDVLSFPPG